MLLIQQVLCEELICDAYSAKLRIKYRPYLVCCDSGSGENTYRFWAGPIREYVFVWVCVGECVWVSFAW